MTEDTHLHYEGKKVCEATHTQRINIMSFFSVLLNDSIICQDDTARIADAQMSTVHWCNNCRERLQDSETPVLVPLYSPQIPQRLVFA